MLGNWGSFHWGIRNNGSGVGDLGQLWNQLFCEGGVCVCVCETEGLRGPRGLPLSPCQRLGPEKILKKMQFHNWFSLFVSLSVSLSLFLPLSHQ